MKKTIGLIIFVLLFCSCARIVTPSGGPKDYTPPKVRKSYPMNNATEFNNKEIRIDFDEYIVLENVSQKLIVSPPLKQKPNVVSKLKSLYIKDLDSLQKNTTYIFDFGDAIRDLNENNPISHFVFSFSTGKDIDTLTYYGRLLNSYTLKSEQGKYVALYSSTDKAIQTSTLPDYITRCDSMGRFHFYNIKEGEYSLLAYDDNNNNLFYDLATEGIGFSTNRIIAKENNDSIFKGDTILFDQARDTVMKVNEAKFSAEKEINISLSMPVSDSFQIEFISPILQEDEYIVDKFLSDTSTNINMYIVSEEDIDTVQFYIKDKNGFQEKKELFYPRKKGRKNEKKTFAFSLQETNIPYYDSIALNVGFPLKKDFILQATLIKDSDSVAISFVQDKYNAKRLVSDYTLQENTKYSLIIDSAIAVNGKGELNDSLVVSFSTDGKEDYSRFILNLVDSNGREEQVILSLFDEKNNKIGKDIIVKGSKEQIVFEHLKEGKYKIRAITDNNRNNQWDRSDFLLNQQAEKVQYYPQTINIRKGWEREEEWSIEK